MSLPIARNDFLFFHLLSLCTFSISLLHPLPLSVTNPLPTTRILAIYSRMLACLCTNFIISISYLNRPFYEFKTVSFTCSSSQKRLLITNFWVFKLVVFEVVENSFEIERVDQTKRTLERHVSLLTTEANLDENSITLPSKLSSINENRLLCNCNFGTSAVLL